MQSSTLTRVLVPVLAATLSAIVAPRAAADSPLAARHDRLPTLGEAVPGGLAEEGARPADRPADDPDLLSG